MSINSSIGKMERYTADSLTEIFEKLGLDVPRFPYEMENVGDWSIEPEVIWVLRELIRRDRPLNIVEVGAMKGDSTISLAEAACEYGGHVYAIEPDLARAKKIENRISNKPFLVKVIPKMSVDAFRDWGREAIDLIIIDADHSFIPQFVDIAMWSSLLSSDGWLVIHDTLTRLERRFPDDYFGAPFLFDVIDFVGLRHRLSSKPWQGVAFVRWAKFARPHVFRRHEV